MFPDFLITRIPYFLIVDGFALQFCVVYPVENSKESDGQNIGGRLALKSRGKWTRRDALPPGGDKIEWYWG